MVLFLSIYFYYIRRGTCKDHHKGHFIVLCSLLILALVPVNDLYNVGS